VRARVWGARGSLPAPGAERARYGGNTSCVEVELSEGGRVILDGGSGIAELGRAPEPAASSKPPLDIVLSHLHPDHIQGLMFFPPLFEPGREVTIWGPPAPRHDLRARLGRYISAPLAPIEISELPAKVEFRDCPPEPWRIGGATLRAELVNHRGTTLGIRIQEDGASLVYLPDHEPALGCPIKDAGRLWVSGLELAAGCDLLLHDAQYTAPEYAERRGWGHSAVGDAVEFALRAGTGRLGLFHHDPGRSDREIEALLADARRLWERGGGAPDGVFAAAEMTTLPVS
jgi:phosphoribosyl 1,2-cyclic phosphodiesterase